MWATIAGSIEVSEPQVAYRFEREGGDSLRQSLLPHLCISTGEMTPEG